MTFSKFSVTQFLYCNWGKLCYMIRKLVGFIKCCYIFISLLKEITELIHTHKKTLKIVSGTLVFFALRNLSIHTSLALVGALAQVFFPLAEVVKGTVNESSLLMGSILASFFIPVFLHFFSPGPQGSVSCHF